MQDIIISGSIAYDYLMRFPGRFTEHLIQDHLEHVSLSFLVDDMTKHWGGVGANIAYTMALLNMRPKVFATVGRDFGDYRDHLEGAGVDCSLVRRDDELFTASFFANTDLDNNQIASFYTGAMALARNYTLADVYEGKPDMVVVSPNDPAAMLQISDECRERGLRFVADPSQQVPRLNGEQLRQCIDGAYLLVINKYESEIICKKVGIEPHELREMVNVLIVTQGKHGSEIFTQGTVTHVDVFPTDNILDPTGVGDAYRAGLLCGIAAELPLKLSAEMGSLSAAYVLEQVGTQNHSFTVEEFVTRFRTHFDDEGRLDVLLAGEQTEV